MMIFEFDFQAQVDMELNQAKLNWDGLVLQI